MKKNNLSKTYASHISTDGFFNFVRIFTVLMSFMGVSVAAPGDLDPTFGTNGKVQVGVGDEDRVFALARQADGKLIAAGGTRINNARQYYAVIRLNTDGSLDAGFGTGGTLLIPISDSSLTEAEARAVVVQADGKIVVSGSRRSSGGGFVNTTLVRLNPNGAIDATFGENGFAMVDAAVHLAMVLQPDGKFVLGGGRGEFQLNDSTLARLNPNGSLDTAFGNGGIIRHDFGNKFGDGLWSLALQADGKIVGSGRVTTGGAPETEVDFLTARFNSDGSLDTSFGAGGKVVTDFAMREDWAYGVRVQGDGKIVVAGRALVAVNNVNFGLVRYHADGSLDASFGTGGKVTTEFNGVSDQAFALELQPNGKIVAVGVGWDTEFSSDVFAIARYLPNGSLDPNFGTGGKVKTFFALNSYARAVIIQPDGKIVAAGWTEGGFLQGQFAVARYLGDAAASGKSFDFDGDGRADQSVFRPSDSVWYLLNSQAGFSTAQFGTSTDKIVPADFDGDGRTDIAVFRNGVWYWRNSSNGTIGVLQFGLGGDQPVPADYTGDGRAELAVYRGGVWWTLNLATNQSSAVQFGIPSDRPVPADFDGDRKTDLAVYRDGIWYQLRSSNNGFHSVQFGLASDVPTVGDYDADGKADQAVYRAGVWYVLGSVQGGSVVHFGLPNDTPAPADYDGDGKTDIAVFREGIWYMLRSQQGFGTVQFGVANDKPIPAAFVP